MNKGFTFIELILVVAIILVVGASSSIFYSRFINQNSVANISDQITEQLHKAQIYSMMGKNNSSWGVRLTGTTLTLFSSASSAFDQNFTFSSAINISGLTTLTFAKVTGIPASTSTITISGGGNSKTLTINSQGVVER